MSRPMTKDEARSWMARWQTVADRERQELRRESYETRLSALAMLMASATLFDYRELDEEDVVVRARWVRLQSLALKR